MITYVNGNLFESKAQVLVNAVNTVGVMGKGIAKAFKDKYPEMFTEYRDLCKQERLEVGMLHIYKTSNEWILNFPTKKHWRNKSELSYVETGLKKFLEIYETETITSIAFPQLGCGLGGLSWEKEVQPLMEKYLAEVPIEIYIHIYKPN